MKPRAHPHEVRAGRLRTTGVVATVRCFGCRREVSRTGRSHHAIAQQLRHEGWGQKMINGKRGAWHCAACMGRPEPPHGLKLAGGGA